MDDLRERCFNPSGGILGVQTHPWLELGRLRPGFNPSGGILGVQTQRPSAAHAGHTHCFNPSGGILGVQTATPHYHLATVCQVSIPRAGFWVFKPVALRVTPSDEVFQSLGRDSGCSNHGRGGSRPGQTRVSIPRAGFWVFKPPRLPGRWIHA